MTFKEKSFLKKTIEEELISLQRHIIELRKLCIPISPECALGDLMRFELINDQAISKKTLINAESKRKNLSISISRINSDDFGLCRECNEEISYARLILIPESDLCITCASNKSV